MAKQARRQTRADARKASERRGGFIKFAIAIVIMATVAAAYIAVARDSRTLDKITLCPERPSSVTVLLVDVTDPMNLPQQQDFQNQLIQLKNSIPRYGQLSVVRVDATASNLLRPVIVRCNPGTASDTDQLKGNPSKLQRQWSEGFDRPLAAAFRSIASASGAAQSPIMESIQSVALTELQRPGQEDVSKRLVVASDLLQNTHSINFYRALPSRADFAISDAFRRVRTDLRGIDVELWQLERDDAGTTQPRALSDLWQGAIEAQGGIVSRIYNVSG